MNARARCYVGIIGRTTRADDRVVVMVLAGGAYDLPVRRDLANHADVFRWGAASGAGGAQLALAILADYFGAARDADALALHRDFGAAVIAQLDRDAGFTISHARIADALARLAHA